MGRLIDESEAIELIKGSDELTDYQKDESITCIRACNTAYDTDKVIEQLQENGYTETQDDMNPCDAQKVVNLDSTIEIVKAGGIKSLSDIQQPTTEKIVRELEEYYEENKDEENSGYILVCIDIVKETYGRMKDGKIN